MQIFTYIAGAALITTHFNLAYGGMTQSSKEGMSDLLSLPTRCQDIVNHQLGKLGLAPLSELALTAGTRNALSLIEIEPIKNEKTIEQLRSEVQRLETEKSELEKKIEGFKSANAISLEKAEQLEESIWEMERTDGSFSERIRNLNQNIRDAKDMATSLESETKATVLAVAKDLEIQLKYLLGEDRPEINKYRALKSELTKYPQRDQLWALENLFFQASFEIHAIIGPELKQRERELRENEFREPTHAIKIATRRDAALNEMHSQDRKIVSDAQKERKRLLNRNKEKYQKWPISQPKDPILAKIYNEENKRSREFIEKTNFNVSSQERAALRRLSLLRAQRENLIILRAGSGLSYIAFHHHRQIEELTVNSSCRVTRIDGVFFESGDSAVYSPEICQEYGRNEICDEYEKFF